MAPAPARYVSVVVSTTATSTSTSGTASSGASSSAFASASGSPLLAHSQKANGDKSSSPSSPASLAKSPSNSKTALKLVAFEDLPVCHYVSYEQLLGDNPGALRCAVAATDAVDAELELGYAACRDLRECRCASRVSLRCAHA